jgi:hypothetical protein
MKFTNDPAERTTAITDIILALVAFGGILFLRYGLPADGQLWKINIWSGAIGLIGMAAALGAWAHGLAVSRTVHDRIWQMLNMCLALAVSLFVAGVIYDLWGLAACIKILPVMLIAGLAFFAATLVYPGIFFVFIIYEGLALILAFGAYIYLAILGQLPGSTFMSAGILVSIIAAGIQAIKSINVKIIWQFDHNGVYHIVQIVGLVMLLAGLRLSLQ